MDPKSIAFLALGDIHLDDFIWSKRRHIAGDAGVAFSSFVDLGIHLGVPLVIVGDLFDTTEPASSLVEFFRLEMERCRAAGVPVFAIQGNHDKRKVPWYVAASSWPAHIGGGQTTDIAGLSVVGFDYAQRDIIETQLADLAVRTSAGARVDVLLLHQAVKQALNFEGAWNCDLDWVPSEVKLTILGDLHRVAKVKHHSEAWYTGSSHARNIDEIGPKSCLAVHKDLTVEQLPIDYRDFLRVRFTPDNPGVMQLPDILEWVTAASANSIAPVLKPVVWVHHTADQNVAVARLKEEIVGTRAFVETEAMASPTEITTETVTGDLPGMPTMLARHIDPEKNPGAFNLALALIDPTADMKQVIADRREAFRAKFEAKA